MIIKGMMILIAIIMSTIVKTMKKWEDGEGRNVEDEES